MLEQNFPNDVSVKYSALQVLARAELNRFT